MTIRRTMTPREWGLLLGLSVIWGGSFLFIGLAVTGLPPLTVVALRLVLAALGFFVIALLTGRFLPRSREAWLAFVVMGILNNVIPFTLIASAQTVIPSGVAAILNATTPLFSVFAAHYLTTDEPITANRVVGAVIGFAGVAVMIGPDMGVALGSGSTLLAELAVLGASMFYAVSGIFGRRFSRMGITPDRAAAGQLTASAIMFVPIALAVDRPWTLAPPAAEVWLAVAGLAFLSTVIGYQIFYRILATAGATNIALVTLLIPPSALLFGTLFLEEQVGLGELAGLALIAIGLAAIDGRPWKALRRSLSR